MHKCTVSCSHILYITYIACIHIILGQTTTKAAMFVTPSNVITSASKK